MYVPPERNPWTEIFSPEVIVGIAQHLNLKSDGTICALGVDLAQLAELYIDYENNMDMQATPTEKSKWIEKNLAAPARQLHDALSGDNYRNYVEAFPNHDLDYIDSAESFLARVERKSNKDDRKLKLLDGRKIVDGEYGPLRTRLQRDLEALIDWADEKTSRIKNAKSGKKWLRTQHKEELVYSLLRLYRKYAPNRQPIRSEHGVKPKNSNSRNNSHFSQFVRITAQPILGHKDNLDDQIKLAISHLKREEKIGS